MRTALYTLLAVLIVLLSAPELQAQQSDYAVKKSFEERYQRIKNRIDSTSSISELDSLKAQIVLFESDFTPRSKFLDKALYPETFGSKISDLQTHQVLTYDRVYLIQTRGIVITQLEAKIALLTGRLDTLTEERDGLFQELQESRKSVASLRETVKRLSANLQAKDKLIFALIDSIFLPYDKNINQVSDVQKDAISRRLEKANIVARIYEVARDNVKFLEMTQLQPKDYGNLIDQAHQFSNRWSGIRDKVNAVYAAGEAAGTKGAGGTGGKSVPPGNYLDSLLMVWNARLQTTYWSGLAQEFTNKGVAVKPFIDARSFSASIRSYVDSAKATGFDATIFVNEVWKDRIDKEWRESLTKDAMLGKAEYAALDKLVSELSEQKITGKFLLYIAIVLAIVFLGWWFLVRKPKQQPPAQTQQ